MIVKQNITSYYLKDITAFFQYKMKLPEIKNPKLITIVGEYHGAKIGCNEDFKSLPIEAFVLLNNNVKTKVILELDHEDDPNYSFNIKNIQDSVKILPDDMTGNIQIVYSDYRKKYLSREYYYYLYADPEKIERFSKQMIIDQYIKPY